MAKSKSTGTGKSSGGSKGTGGGKGSGGKGSGGRSIGNVIRRPNDGNVIRERGGAGPGKPLRKK